jgi:hypothetical protein
LTTLGEKKLFAVLMIWLSIVGSVSGPNSGAM